MKKLIAIFLIVATVMTLALAVNADNLDVVKQGTPTIDGKFDKMYMDSNKFIGASNPDFVGANAASGDPIIGKEDIEGYALWDSSALYFYVVVWDTTPCSGDKFSFFVNMDSVTYVPSICPLTGEVSFGTEGGWDEAASHMLAGYDEVNNYCWCEVKLVPAAAHKGSVLYGGNSVQFHFCYWNDIDNDGSDDNYTTSGFFNNDHMSLKAAKATSTGIDETHFKKGSEPQNPVTPGTTKPAETTKGGNNPKPAPQTSDATLIVGAVALCAAAAAVIVVKKKRD